MFNSLNFSASIASILALIISIILIITTESTRKRVDRLTKFKTFKEDKISLSKELQASYYMLIKDNSDAPQIERVFRKIENYTEYMNKGDRRALQRSRKLIRKKLTEKNLNKLEIEIQTLLGFLEIQMEYDFKLV